MIGPIALAAALPYLPVVAARQREFKGAARGMERLKLEGKGIQERTDLKSRRWRDGERNALRLVANDAVFDVRRKG